MVKLRRPAMPVKPAIPAVHDWIVNNLVDTIRYAINKDILVGTGTNSCKGITASVNAAATALTAAGVTKADCLAVLAAIKPKIKKALLAGQRVVLSELGSFVISLQGKSYNAETMADEDFRPSGYIKGHRILFRAEPALKKEIARVKTILREKELRPEA